MTKQRVLITGASTGIGRACAIRIARRGFTVFAGVRSSVDAERLRAEVTGDLRPVQLDVTRSIEIEAMLAEMGGQPLAGLVNNAGIAIAGPLELIPMDAWRRQIEVNLLGLVAVTQACLPALRSGRGRIVNIGSIAGRLALPGSSAYDASKFARLILCSGVMPFEVADMAFPGHLVVDCRPLTRPCHDRFRPDQPVIAD